MLVGTNNRGSYSVRTFCRMCSYRCPIAVFVEDDKIIKIAGDRDHPVSKGRLCVKGNAIMDLLYSQDRIFTPLKKVNGQWHEIDLDLALDEIAQRLLSIRKKHGAKSIGVWKGESVDQTQGSIPRRFAMAFGTPNIFSHDTMCAVSKQTAIKSVVGSFLTPDFQNTKCIVLWGCNPLASHYPLYNSIKEAKKRGAKVILIDPINNSFSRIADMHIPIKPATDGALALGIINIIIDNNWYDQEIVNKYTVGFERLAQYAKIFNTNNVSNETGVGEEDIYKISKAIAENAPRSTYRVGVGPEHHDNGFNNIRAIACIGALCGCTDRVGGDKVGTRPNLNSLCAGMQENLKGLKPIGANKYPVFYNNRQEGHSIMAMDAMLEDKPYPLRGLILTGANPVLTNPNADKVRNALESLDLFVARDLFMTETTKLADYFLPAATFLERSEVIGGSLPQSIALTKKVMEFGTCQNEYQFWSRLANKVGIGHYFPWDNEDELNKWIIAPLGINLKELGGKHEGYIYEPYDYEKFYSNGFATPSGKIEFISGTLENLGYDGLPVYRQPHYLKDGNKGNFKYILITGARLSRFNHSCYHNIPRFKKVAPWPIVEVHPEDAVSLQIGDGDMVEITSAKGSLKIRASIVDKNRILKGYLQITHGFKEANVNMITPDDVIDPVSGFPAVKSVPVNVTRLLSAGNIPYSTISQSRKG